MLIYGKGLMIDIDRLSLGDLSFLLEHYFTNLDLDTLDSFFIEIMQLLTVKAITALFADLYENYRDVYDYIDKLIQREDIKQILSTKFEAFYNIKENNEGN